MTQGKGEFSMEYLRHAAVMPNIQKELVFPVLAVCHMCVLTDFINSQHDERLHETP